MVFHCFSHHFCAVLLSSTSFFFPSVEHESGNVLKFTRILFFTFLFKLEITGCIHFTLCYYSTTLTRALFGFSLPDAYYFFLFSKKSPRLSSSISFRSSSSSCHSLLALERTALISIGSLWKKECVVLL